MTSTIEAPAAELIYIDPKKLILRGNSRDIGDLAKRRPAFVASVGKYGVLQALKANRTPDGNVHVVFGFSRAAAALLNDLPLVPALAVDTDDPYDDEKVRLLEQVAENEHREDYTNAERASNYERLALFGLSAEEIAEQTNTDQPLVEAGLTAARSESARAALERLPQLDLVTAAAFEEFTEWPEAIEDFVHDLDNDPDELAHTIAVWRDRVERHNKLHALASELREQGYTVYTARDELPAQAKELHNLVVSHTDKTRLSADVGAHEKCEGHVLRVTTRWRQGEYIAEAEPWCLDWRKHEHVDWVSTLSFGNSSTPAKPTTTPEQDTAARRRVRENNPRWRSTEEQVRRPFLCKLASGKKPPKQAQRFINEVLSTATYEMRRACEKNHRFACELFGYTFERGKPHPFAPTSRDTEQASTLKTLAMLVGALEETLSVKSWRNPSPEAQLYFRWLAFWGYKLSKVEQLVLDPKADAADWPLLNLAGGDASIEDIDEDDLADTETEPNSDDAVELEHDAILENELDNPVPSEDTPAEEHSFPTELPTSDEPESIDAELEAAAPVTVPADIAELYAALADGDEDLDLSAGADPVGALAD